ncbi:hypothetical protein BDW71DRAFT_186772 [Aspergillus fruticulosus]
MCLEELKVLWSYIDNQHHCCRRPPLWFVRHNLSEPNSLARLPVSDTPLGMVFHEFLSRTRRPTEYGRVYMLENRLGCFAGRGPLEMTVQNQSRRLGHESLKLKRF